MNLSRFSRILAFACFALSAGWAGAMDHGHAAMETKAAAAVGTSAIAVLVPGVDSKVSGTIKFTQEKGGVRVVADVKGLTPGLHGFHVHEKGDLSKPDLTSAGGHFNPTGHPHAGREATERHAGDLGNLEAGADGRASADFLDTKLQLAGAESIIGRAVIVHAKADDLKSQPTGDAGGRVAGGVIGIVEPDGRAKRN